MMADNEPLVYLNGGFVPRSQATLDIEDRGAMFADGVYEVIRYYNGRPFRLQDHIHRLRTSLNEIELPPPPAVEHLDAIGNDLLQRNRLGDAKLYWQITRGSAPRDHAFPMPAKPPTVLGIAYQQPPLNSASPAATATAILTEDLRWPMCSIKSLMLLPNVLAKNKARLAGADEAILHRQGRVTEGTATSVFAVRAGELWTHEANQWVLGGITRQALLELARQAGTPVVEQALTTEQLLHADEVLMCGTTSHVTAVVAVDGQPIGDGRIGPITAKLHAALLDHIRQTCGL